MEWMLELALTVLLAATLFHALRLERALGVLKRDRAALEDLVAAFNSSTQMAEQGIERLRGSADGAGKQISRQIERASSLREDLQFLSERGDVLADRLEGAIRQARAVLPDPHVEPMMEPPPPPMVRMRELQPVVSSVFSPDEPEPRLRSQAERDLLKALRMAR